MRLALKTHTFLCGGWTGIRADQSTQLARSVPLTYGVFGAISIKAHSASARGRCSGSVLIPERSCVIHCRRARHVLPGDQTGGP